MRRLTSTALAGALALSTVAATTPVANAGGPPHHHPYHQYSGPGPGAALAAGAFLGLALGALTAPRYYGPVYPYPYVYTPPPPPVSIYYPPTANAHISWCFRQYGAAYNPATNLWRDIYGNWHPCY